MFKEKEIMQELYGHEEKKVMFVIGHWLESIYYVKRLNEWHIETFAFIDELKIVYRWCFKEKLPEMVFESIPKDIRNDLIKMAKRAIVLLPRHLAIEQENFVIDITKIEKRESDKSGEYIYVCVEPDILQFDDKKDILVKSDLK